MSDPIQIYAEVPSWYTWQKKALERLRLRNCWICSRQIGKSTLLRYILATVALERDSKLKPGETATYWYVSGVFSPNCYITYDCLRAMLKPLIDQRQVYCNKNDLQFVLPNGTKIEMKSGDKPQNLVGATLNGVILDEIQDQKRDVWERAIQPMLTAKAGWAILAGTMPDPYTAADPDFAEELIAWAQTKEKEGDRWTAVLETIHAIKTENARQYKEVTGPGRDEMSTTTWRREYLCEAYLPGEGELDAKKLRHFYVSGKGQVWRSDLMGSMNSNFESLIVVDPALTHDRGSDPSTVTTYLWDQDRNWFTLFVAEVRGQYSDVMDEIYRQRRETQILGFPAPRVGVEKLGGGQILLDMISDSESNHFTGIFTKELKGSNKKGAKFQRIVALEQWLTRGRMFVRVEKELEPFKDDPNEFLSPGMENLIHQMGQFPKGLQTNVRQKGADGQSHHYDILDCAGHAIQHRVCPPQAGPIKTEKPLPKMSNLLKSHAVKAMKKAAITINEDEGGWGW